MNAMASGTGRSRRLSATAVVLAVLVFLASCDSPADPGTSPTVPVAHLELSPDHVVLWVGASVRLGASAFAADGTPVDDALVRWSSADPSVVTVTPTGFVTAVAAGRAGVRASADDVEAVAEVTVLSVGPIGMSITALAPESVTAGGEGFTLTVSGWDFGEDALVLWRGSPRPTTYVSDRELRAEINVLDTWEVGSAPVTVTRAQSGGTTEPKTFTILPSAVARVSLAPDTLRLDPFEEGRFQGELLDEGGAPVPGRYMAWSVVNGGVAQVFGDGSVRGIRPGTTRVRLANGVHFAEATVVVGPFRVHYVTVEPHHKAVLVGEQVQLTARTFAMGGEELFGREVTWYSTNPAVATVDATGRVSARARGTANVYAESEGRTNWAVIEVREWPESPVWTFDMQKSPTDIIEVGDSTWVDSGGATQRATLVLLGGTLTLDRGAGTYRQRLRVAVVGQSYMGETTREDQGSFQTAVYPPNTFLFLSSSTPGTTFSGRISGPAELTIDQKIGTAERRPYLYRVR